MIQQIYLLTTRSTMVKRKYFLAKLLKVWLVSKSQAIKCFYFSCQFFSFLPSFHRYPPTLSHPLPSISYSSSPQLLLSYSPQLSPQFSLSLSLSLSPSLPPSLLLSPSSQLSLLSRSLSLSIYLLWCKSPAHCPPPPLVESKYFASIVPGVRSVI